MKMSTEKYCIFIVVVVIWTQCVYSGTSRLPEVLVMDDASREILFLDLYKRVSALEARTQMSDAIDWTQQVQFDRLKALAENQQKWLKDVEALCRPNQSCDNSPSIKRAAFSVYLSHDIDSTMNNELIIFDKVLLNEGNYYDETTGIFTCPWDGVYDISFFLGQRGSPGNPGAWLKLLVNDKQVVWAVADATDTDQDVQGGNRVILRLKAGDIAKVVIVGGDNCHVEGDKHCSTTFSGVYLYN